MACFEGAAMVFRDSGSTIRCRGPHEDRRAYQFELYASPENSDQFGPEYLAALSRYGLSSQDRG